MTTDSRVSFNKTFDPDSESDFNDDINGDEDRDDKNI